MVPYAENISRMCSGRVFLVSRSMAILQLFSGAGGSEGDRAGEREGLLDREADTLRDRER